MQGGHIAETLAQSLSALGDGYIFLMPVIGALGGYMTASGTGTNAMFGPTQVAVGGQLDIHPQWSMALNNAAGCWARSPRRHVLSWHINSPAGHRCPTMAHRLPAPGYLPSPFRCSHCRRSSGALWRTSCCPGLNHSNRLVVSGREA